MTELIPLFHCRACNIELNDYELDLMDIFEGLCEQCYAASLDNDIVDVIFEED